MIEILNTIAIGIIIGYLISTHKNITKQSDTILDPKVQSYILDQYQQSKTVATGSYAEFMARHGITEKPDLKNFYW